MAVVLICGDAHQIADELVTSMKFWINSMSSSLLVYQGPLVRAMEGFTGRELHRRHALNEAFLH